MNSLNRRIHTSQPFRSFKPSTLRPSVQFSGIADSLKKARDENLLSGNTEESKAASETLTKELLVVGDRKLTGLELLKLMEEMTPPPPRARSGPEKSMDWLIGFSTLGIVPLVKFYKTGVKTHKIAELFAEKKPDVEQRISTAYFELNGHGLVEAINGDSLFSGWRFRLSPLGREVLARKAAADKENQTPANTEDSLAISTMPETTSSVKEDSPQSGTQSETGTQETAKPDVFIATDPEVIEKQTTLTNSKGMGNSSLASTQNQTPLAKLQQSIEQTRNRMQGNKYTYLFMAVFGGLFTMLGVELQSKYQQQAEVYRQVDERVHTPASIINRAIAEDALMQAKVANSLMFGLVGFMLLLGATVTAIDYRILRKDLKEAKRLENSLVQLTPEKETVDQRLVQFLIKSIDADSEQMAKQFQTLYEQQPEARSALDEVFGSREQLPTAGDIRQLFKYYTYHLLLKEQGVSGWNGNTPVAESEFYTKMSALMRIGMERGELFEFVKANRDKPFGQQFDEELFGHVDLMLNKTQTEVLAAKTLLTRDVEIEGQLKMARKALVRSGLSTVNRKEQTDEILKIIDAFKGYQAKIHQTLEQAAQSPNPIDMDALSVNSLDEMIFRLKTALAVEQQQTEFDATVGQAMEKALTETAPAGRTETPLQQLQSDGGGATDEITDKKRTQAI